MKPTTILIIFILSISLTNAQIRIEVVKHPPFLVKDAPLFIACSFDSWNPGNEEFKLKKAANGHYFIDLSDTLDYFEYKFTQGNWIMVEGNGEGGTIQNRFYRKSDLGNPNLIQTEIKGWERNATYTFVVKSVPKNTPQDAQLYIAGNFNNWKSDDPLSKLQKQFDGTYRAVIYSDLDKIEYKFTRGTWEAVEGRETGKARPNRLLNRNDSFDHNNIELTIESWEDLSGTFNFYSIYDLLLLFSAFQGFLLVIFIPTIQDYNRNANRWLVILLALMSSMILLKIIGNYREFAQSYTKIVLLPDFIIFLFSPLFYFYIQKLLFKAPFLPRRWWLHFIPALILFFVYLPYFLSNSKIFQLKIVNQDIDLQVIFNGIGLVGLVFNIFYWFQNRKAIKTYKAEYQTHASYEQNLQYLNTVIIIQAICLVLWLFTVVLSIFQKLIPTDSTSIIENSIDGIWLVFSIIIYFLGYFAIHQPEIFKLPQQENFENNEFDLATIKVEELTAKTVEIAQPDENIQFLKEKLEVFMEKQKPFNNPNLTLAELASKLKISPHTLSKVINDGFEKNFFDFINGYRINQFKQLVEDPRFKNYTLLGIAFEVGFNSKTAFNRSFKKITNQTPSEYFHQLQKNTSP